MVNSNSGMKFNSILLTPMPGVQIMHKNGITRRPYFWVQLSTKQLRSAYLCPLFYQPSCPPFSRHCQHWISKTQHRIRTDRILQHNNIPSVRIWRDDRLSLVSVSISSATIAKTNQSLDMKPTLCVLRPNILKSSIHSYHQSLVESYPDFQLIVDQFFQILVKLVYFST